MGMSAGVQEHDKIAAQRKHNKESLRKIGDAIGGLFHTKRRSQIQHNRRVVKAVPKKN